MNSQIITKLRTKEDLDLLQGELELLKNSLYQKDRNYKEVLENDIRSWVSEIVTSESKEAGIEKYLEDAEAGLKSVSIVSAVIAFEPSDSFINRFSVFIKTNVSPNAVIDFLFNRELLGGIQLSYRGKYIDLSLRGRVAKEFDDPELLKKFSPAANMAKTGKQDK